MKYIALGESLVRNTCIALCHICYLDPQLCATCHIVHVIKLTITVYWQCVGVRKFGESSVVRLTWTSQILAYQWYPCGWNLSIRLLKKGWRENFHTWWWSSCTKTLMKSSPKNSFFARNDAKSNLWPTDYHTGFLNNWALHRPSLGWVSYWYWYYVSYWYIICLSYSFSISPLSAYYIKYISNNVFCTTPRQSQNLTLTNQMLLVKILKLCNLYTTLCRLVAMLCRKIFAYTSLCTYIHVRFACTIWDFSLSKAGRVHIVVFVEQY